ncbi:MMPL family transporter [Robbsia andropogonis]|uniref:MMPL family transporter n=1 Tax=Robbsia andropogonis TaxID=28092 RepID=UPI0004677DAA|nr:MMPL family transporter [Robbsia andropogonis]MCP1120185.1 MMPL family transporter [Robbsia andropogonis]MCP1129983.1 MMPL family transporter [Robbsia andropogonis]
MLTSWIARVVNGSVRRPWTVVGVALVLVLVSAWYAATHFAINTDINGLIDSKKPWAQRDRQLDAAFPGRSQTTLVVIDAPAPELADQAANELAAHLAGMPARFHDVTRPDGGAFFEKNGLLYLSPTALRTLSTQLGEGKSLLNSLARDPSLRGLANLLSVTLLVPVQTGKITLPQMATLLSRSADAVDGALANTPAALSWRDLAQGTGERGATAGGGVQAAAPGAASGGAVASTQDTDARTSSAVRDDGATFAVPSGVKGQQPGRAFISAHPVLDYSALEPSAAASDAIRQAAVDLHLAQRYHARVRLTGARPLSDEEFSSVAEGAVPNAIVTLLLVVAILWYALRSVRLVLAVFVVLIGGLAVTAALGLLMVGALNLISVAFAVLFIGIGVDFSIQFGVRYREERFLAQDLTAAMRACAAAIALPLSLAAVATAVAFFSFLPTAYRGISELGLIAGVGILFVAFPSSITVLPALIALLKPTGERAPPGFRFLEPVDRLFERKRKPILIVTLALVIAGLPLLAFLRFDFNPLSLKDPHSESMTTLSALGAQTAGINDISVLTDSPTAARALAQRLAALPEVARALSLDSFLPDDQAEKLAIIAQLRTTLEPILSQTPLAPATDAARVSALRNAAMQLDSAVLDHPGPGAAQAKRLAESLRKLASADAAARDRAEDALALPLRISLARLSQMLQPTTVDVQTLPAALRENWLNAKGQALVQVSPRVPAHTASSDDAMLKRFTDAVQRVAPQAVGGPISIIASADAIITAFIQATAIALVAVTLLLWLALRRFSDVLRTLVPLIVSGAVTLELCVIIGLPLNFANIIALPLLLGIGVAFKIYYVLAWRRGQTRLLSAGLTQAVILSAATTATAFGSLWLSHHPGTSSMGRLLTLSLVCTLIGAVFFQPILMGKPRASTADRTPDPR